MTEVEYRQKEGVSRSELWRLMESPEKFKWYKEHPTPPTPALVFGAATHKMLLEPETWGECYAVAPDVDRRTKLGKEQYAFWLERVGDREIVSNEDYTVLFDMTISARTIDFVNKLLNGEKEVPLFWNDDLTGEPCKARLDCLTTIAGKPIIVDYKTTNDASTDGFMRSAIKYGYDFQAAMYSEAYKANFGTVPTFVFIAQEKTPPYAVNILQADDVFIKRGYDIFRQLIGTYHDCKQSNNWWGYLGPYNVINNLALPAWLAKEID